MKKEVVNKTSCNISKTHPKAHLIKKIVFRYCKTNETEYSGAGWNGAEYSRME